MEADTVMRVKHRGFKKKRMCQLKNTTKIIQYS